METVCKKLKFEDRWVVRNPVGRKGRMLMSWSIDVQASIIRSSDFYMEVKIETGNKKDDFWGVFVHASTDATERKGQWEVLKERKQHWGENELCGGDFNDIKTMRK